VHLLDVINPYVYLEEDGQFFRGSCPFHFDEKNVFSVDVKKNSFSCPDCKISGNGVFDFVKQIRNISEEDALIILREMYNLKFLLSEKERELEPLYEANKRAAELFHRQLFSNLGPSSPFAYLQERGISDISIMRFKLGYSPNAWDFALQALKQDFSPEILEQAGLVVHKEESNMHFDRFRDRIMFPVFDISGRVVGFAGRNLPGQAEDIAKYINSLETPIYKKGSTLYGLNFASRAIKEKNQIIIVEGYTDVILAHQNRQENVVASCSTAVTPAHAQLIRRRYTQAECLICYDGDEPGRNASLRTATALLGRLDAKIVLLPEGKDPADIYKEGGSLGPFLTQGQSISDFYFANKINGRKFDNLEALTLFLTDEIRSDFQQIPYSSVGFYAEELGKRLGVRADLIREILQIDKKRKRMPQREFWETQFISCLLASGPSLESLIYFRSLDEEFAAPYGFVGRETELAYSFLMENLPDSSSTLNFAGTSLFGEQKLLEYAGKNKKFPDAKKIKALFEPYREKPNLKDMHHAYLMMRACTLPGEIERAHSAGVNSISLLDYLKEVPRDGH